MKNSPMRHWHLVLISLVLLAQSSDTLAQMKGSGLPIPRFVSLKSDEINVRTGPGTRYPISWVYRREALPVEVVEEFDNWRKVRDFENAEGWVLKNMLAGERTVLIGGKDTQTLYQKPDTTSTPTLRAAPNVVGQLIACEKDWCRIQIESRKGWIEKKNIWGVYPNEEFE